MWEFTFEFGERYKVHYTNGFRYNRLENVKKKLLFLIRKCMKYL